jgi:hypothetical protein
MGRKAGSARSMYWKKKRRGQDKKARNCETVGELHFPLKTVQPGVGRPGCTRGEGSGACFLLPS